MKTLRVLWCCRGGGIGRAGFPIYPGWVRALVRCLEVNEVKRLASQRRGQGSKYICGGPRRPLTPPEPRRPGRRTGAADLGSLGPLTLLGLPSGAGPRPSDWVHPSPGPRPGERPCPKFLFSSKIGSQPLRGSEESSSGAPHPLRSSGWYGTDRKVYKLGPRTVKGGGEGKDG